MSERSSIDPLIRELEPLLGAKIQRVDVVAEQALVIELRCPGRTFRLYVAAQRPFGRVHLVDDRPAKTAPGGAFQALLRKRLVGRSLLHLSGQARVVTLAGEDVALRIAIDKGKEAFSFLTEEEWPPKMTLATPVRSFGDLEFPLNDAEAQALEVEGPVEAASRLRASLDRARAAEEKKARRLLANLEKDRSQLAALGGVQKHGELLKSSLGKIKRGAPSVRVTDWETGEDIDIALDPALSAKDNLERFFRRAKRSQRGLAMVEARITKIQARLAGIQAERLALVDADLPKLLGIAEGVDAGSPLDRPSVAQPAGKRSPIDTWAKAFVAADGSEIRVGRGAKQNDRLTFGAARADDLWFHASGAGAHVILRNPKGKSPHPEALLDAATLAAYHSSQKGDTKVEVIWTEARYVKKTKGAPPGQVGISKTRTMIIEMEPARLARLLKHDKA